VFVIVPLVLINRRFVQGDASPFHAFRHDRPALLVAAALAVVGAPIIEELFFRGLLMRALQHVTGTAGAVVVQAFVFGLCHMNPVYGLLNVGVVASITVFGIIVGAVAQRYRRLGPGMAAHAFFNLLAVVVMLVVS
jgi:uncharacterized protein